MRSFFFSNIDPDTNLVEKKMSIDIDNFLYLGKLVLMYRYKKSPISIPIFFPVLRFPWSRGCLKKIGIDIKPITDLYVSGKTQVSKQPPFVLFRFFLFFYLMHFLPQFA